ncbi:MAG: LysM peptidoglycan-binding domain-containing protein [Rickettsia endosymbiont of Ecitomorpha arachnoides]|nr:LysM peptidoglycan-binding domain-containing protein [Rickettsia endosymbiont of Ecitomorpha arachnoides]
MTKKEYLQKLGINLTAKQYEIIKNYAEVKSKGNDISNLKDQLKKLDFTITPEMSQKLLMYSIEEKYKIIKTSIGEEHWDKLNLARQIGVMDHAFHWGNVVELKESLIAGNYNETAQIMKDVITKPSLKARAELRADLVESGKMEFEGVYIVKSGDNLGKIAQLHCLKLDELKKLNPELSKLTILSVGRKINIPPTVKIIPLIDIDDEGNKLFKFEIVHNKCKISEDNIAGETKEILLSVGPFFVRLKANNQVTNIGQCSQDSSFFLSKTSLNTPIENSIIDLFKSTQGVTEGSMHTKTLNLTKEQYNKILQYIESGIKYGDTKVLQSQTSTNETSNNIEHHYLVKADDSASLVQNLYHATGLPLYFTAAYSKPELVNLESIDAKKALEAYSSRDDIIKKLNSIYGDSKEEIAKMLNIDPEQVSRASKLKGCVPTCRAVEGTKFSVKIDQEMLDSITSVIDVSDNKSIQARDVLDINNMCKELNELFLRFKIPPEISQDDSSSKPSTSSAKDNNEFTNQDSNYGNFQKLKDYIKEEILKDKGKLDKLLQTVDKQEQSTSSGNHYTEQELISIYHKQIEVLQEEFKNTQEYYQKNPDQYKYEPGERYRQVK